MQFGFKSNILSFFLVCFYFSFLKLALQVFGFVSVTLVTFVMWFIISVSYLFLLFIGLFSNICKYDILSGGLQPHGSCLFQCKGTLELPWGGSFAVPPLSTAAFAVFWAASLLQNHIHPFGKIHPTLIFLPGVFSAQRFLGKNRIFLKSFGIFRKKKKPSQTWSHLVLSQFLQNSAERLSPILIPPLGHLNLPEAGHSLSWPGSGGITGTPGTVQLPPLQLPVFGFLNCFPALPGKCCEVFFINCKWPVCPVCLEGAQIPHCPVPWPGWGFLLPVLATEHLRDAGSSQGQEAAAELKTMRNHYWLKIPNLLNTTLKN